MYFNVEKSKNEKYEKQKVIKYVHENYELHKPANSKVVLVLFGGYPEKVEDIKREFPILEHALENQIAVIFMKYNQKLWLEEYEKSELNALLTSLFSDHHLPFKNTYLGGFSSGGNIAMLLGEFLVAHDSKIEPKGIFIVDSPIDLLALYRSSQKNIQRSFSDISVQESTWLIQMLEERFGKPEEPFSNYERYSVYCSETQNIEDLRNLKKVKIRLYTEPDTLWWRKYRRVDIDQTNSFYLQGLSEVLSSSNFKYVELINTIDKGYRANGERHPHSWSIVDKNDLMDWMMESDAYSPISSSELIIPFRLSEQNNIIVEAILNKADTVQWMLHTAATSASLIREASSRLESITWVEETEVSAWGGKGNARMSPGNVVKLGDLEFAEQEIWENERSGTSTDGKFGLNLFKDYAVEIDFKRQHIVLHDSLPIVVENFAKLSLENKDGLLFLKGTSSIDHQSFENSFLLHTGYAGYLLFDDAFVTKNHLGHHIETTSVSELKDSFGNVVKTKKGILPQFVLAEMQFEDLPIGFFEGSIGRQKMSVMGGGFLRQFHILFSKDRNTVYMRLE